jgi:hypothetical protein
MLTAGACSSPVDPTPPPALPTVTCPADASAVSNDGNPVPVTYTVPTAVGGATPVAVVCAPPSGSSFKPGSTAVTCTATGADGSISTKTFTVTVQDTTPPVITVPANITVTIKRGNSAVVTFSVSAHDLVDGNVAATATPPSGSTFPVGTTSVTVMAHDSHGNFAAKSFSVTVKKKKRR